MPGRKAVSILHRPKAQNYILSFFRFLQKKVYWLEKKVPSHFCITLGVVIFKKWVAKPLDPFNECRRFLLSSRKIWKMTKFHFWAGLMLRQPRVRASRASPAQKCRCLRVNYSKLFMGFISYILGSSVGWYVFALFSHETNRKKKCSVRLCWALDSNPKLVTIQVLQNII